MIEAGMLEPQGDKLIVELIDDTPTETAGGVVIAQAFAEKTTKGRVVAVGPGARAENGQRVPLPVEVGDVIVFSKYGGTELNLDAGHLFLREPDLIAVVDEGSE